MIETEDPREKIKANIAAYQAAIAAGTHTQKDLDDYLSEVHEARTGKPFVDPAPVTEPERGTLDKVLGTIAATGRDIPGVEAVQAGARSLARRQPYREALSDIRGAEDAAPAVARGAARFAGGALSAAAIPAGAIRQGAMYGFGHALGNADPDVDLKTRIDNAGKEGATGAALGGAVNLVGGLANVAKNAPAGAVMKTVREIPGVPRVQRIAKAWRPAEAAASRPVSLTAPRRVPALDETIERMVAPPANAPGFVGNSMDNVIDAVKANQRPTLDPRTSSVDDVLKDLLERSRKFVPRGEQAPSHPFTDAEIAMGLDQPAANLGAQLEESLAHIQKGGSLASVRSATPTYAGNPVLRRP